MSSPTRGPKESLRNIQLETSSHSQRSVNDGKENRPFSKRPVKKNPLIHKSDGDDGRETRRKLFLKKVREGSEDRRWEARGGDDEMMRSIWISEQRRREERRAREADLFPSSQDEDDIDSIHEQFSSSMPLSTVDEDLADEVAQLENAEMENMLAMLAVQSTSQLPPKYEESDSPYGSDDDELDDIMMEVLNDVDGIQHQQAEIRAQTFDTIVDMMDMS